MSYIIYTKENCPWCLKAKALLNHYKASFELKYEKCDEWDSFPAIYKVNGEETELIGGFTELVNYSFNNEL